tara:strand:+ start:671 stop:1567 length:897 start_codon:yes stop_codon:yes gene_type:complete
MRIKLDLADYEAFAEWWENTGRDTVTRTLGKKVLDTVHWAFRNQGKAKLWPPRKAPNVAGIIRRVNRQENPEDTDFMEMAALIDSGKLRNSFKVTTPTLGKSTVGWTEVRSRLPRADRMQRGLVDRMKLDAVGRKHLAVWLKLLPKDERRWRRWSIGWLLNKKRKNKSYKVKPHKRVMLALEPRDRAELGGYVIKTIEDFKSKAQYKTVTTYTKNIMAGLGNKNVVGFERAGRVSHFGPKKTRGKEIYKMLRRVKVKETESAFAGGRDLKRVWDPSKILKRFTGEGRMSPRIDFPGSD